jgi:hypothetical protein
MNNLDTWTRGTEGIEIGKGYDLQLFPHSTEHPLSSSLLKSLTIKRMEPGHAVCPGLSRWSGK